MPSTDYLSQLTLPAPDSHKGQNGKVLIIGGSELFHAASKWSLDIASKFVDMVFYASIPSNNDLIKEAKGEFWNGIVVDLVHLEAYVHEADVVLIGPGMTRTQDTAKTVNSLVRAHPDKKWVIDAGALQMMEIDLLNRQMIITPHQGEFKQLIGKAVTDDAVEAEMLRLSRSHDDVCILLKGVVDRVVKGGEFEEITGGNAGMTKGGTGDVLAGLVAALYCRYDALTAAVIGSYVNKKAGDQLWQTVGPYFNASDLVEEIPRVLWKEQSTS